MNLVFAMRTADRAPKQNYLRQTLLNFQRAGGDLASLRLCSTAPETAWLTRELIGLKTVILNVPIRRRGANENGLAAIEWSLNQSDMIAVLEDDLAFCADFPGSLSRWLDHAVRPDRHVYRCFGFTRPPTGKPAAYDWPLASARASQAIILTNGDARAFVTWGRAHLHDWVGLAPWGRQHVAITDPTIGFDKFVATWALLTWPGVPGVMSHPCLVDHIGVESSLHKYGLTDHRFFGGSDWAYQEAAE